MTREHALEFHEGFWFWVKGWRFLLQNRSLLGVAILPILISTGAAVALVWLLWVNLPQWVQILVTWIGVSGWVHHLLYYPLLVSGALLALFSSVYVLYLAQSLIAVPFYAFLAERTLGKLGKKADDQKMWREWVANTFKMIRVSLTKFIFLLCVGLVLFVFSFLPVLNVFTLIAAMMILALDCMDYSLDPYALGFRARMRYFRRNWAQWLGMTAGLALTLLLPGLTLLVIPGAVVGAAIIVKNEGL